MVDGRADGDGSGVDSSGGGFVAFGEDAFFALVEEGLLGGCHGCFDLLVALISWLLVACDGWLRG